MTICTPYDRLLKTRNLYLREIPKIASMKIWTIAGIHEEEDFTADLVVDADGDVIEAEYPLHELLGLAWVDARQYCIDRNWHGDRSPSHIRGNSELRRRGWTDREIKTHLPEPDAIEPNPHHPNGSPMKLYAIARVEAIEQSYLIGACKAGDIATTV